MPYDAVQMILQSQQSYCCFMTDDAAEPAADDAAGTAEVSQFPVFHQTGRREAI